MQKRVNFVGNLAIPAYDTWGLRINALKNYLLVFVKGQYDILTTHWCLFTKNQTSGIGRVRGLLTNHCQRH